MDAVGKFNVVQEESQRLRTNSVRNRLLLVETFCRIAETRSRWYEADEARVALSKVNRELKGIRQHLHKQAYVSPESLPELNILLYRLQQRSVSLSLSLSLSL